MFVSNNSSKQSINRPIVAFTLPTIRCRSTLTWSIEHRMTQNGLWCVCIVCVTYDGQPARRIYVYPSYRIYYYYFVARSIDAGGGIRFSLSSFHFWIQWAGTRVFVCISFHFVPVIISIRINAAKCTLLLMLLPVCFHCNYILCKLLPLPCRAS